MDFPVCEAGLPIFPETAIRTGFVAGQFSSVVEQLICNQ